MSRQRANLTGIERRDPRFLVQISETGAAAPDTIGGADEGEPTGTVTPTIGRYVSTGYADTQEITTTAQAMFPNSAKPIVVLTAPGTYLIEGWLQIDLDAATTTTQTVTIDVRRQNNSPGFLNGEMFVAIGPGTLVTRTVGMFPLPPFVYTTTVDDDEIVIFAKLSAAAAAGKVDAVSGTLVALRLS